MRKYLITGVSGFVAFHFLQYLDSLGKEIEVLGIDVAVSPGLQKIPFRYIKLRIITLNLLEYKTLEAVIVSFSPGYVIHLASFSSVARSWQEPSESFVNNTNIFLNIIEVIRRNSIKCRILSIGSSEEYGNVSEECMPLKETEKLNPISPYAIARVSQEMLSRCYVESYRLDIILTRSFNHIGTMQKDIFVISSFVKQILESIKRQSGDIILETGDLSIIRDFLDVRDVVRAYYLLLEKGTSGELYNVCGGVGYSLSEIVNMVGTLLRVAIQTKIIAENIRPNDNRIIIGDNTKIFQAVGWRPAIPLEDSLKDIISYWREELNRYANC
jgi:GDP-4-dehydro-6-deoxy-D-mannose reductase